MNTTSKFAVAVLAGVAIGAAAIQGLHAQAKAPAYTIAEIEVTDPANYKTYVDANSAGVEKAGGHFLARGGKVLELDGAVPKRFALIAWDNAEQAQAYYKSATYTALIPNRDKSSKFRAYIAEGIAK
jgi:uncharacterized protein (DUF1330 family)